MSRIEISLQEYNFLKEKKIEVETENIRYKQENEKLKQDNETLIDTLLDFTELSFAERTLNWSKTKNKLLNYINK